MRFCFSGLTVESHLDPYDPGRAPWRFLTSDGALKNRIDQTLAGYRPGRNAGPASSSACMAPSPTARRFRSRSDARASIELITAAYHSAATGETVRLPIGTDHPAYAGWRR